MQLASVLARDASPAVMRDWLGAIEDPCVGRRTTIEPQASKCKAAAR